MAAEAQRAPRVASDRTSMADAAAAARPSHGFQFNHTSYFDRGSDEVISTLEQAHSVALALSIAMDAGCLREVHGRRVVDAIATLIAVAARAAGASE